MAKRKSTEDEVVDVAWRKCDGSDEGSFSAEVRQTKFNPYLFETMKPGDTEFIVSLSFEGRDPIEFYMRWNKSKPPITLSDTIDFLVYKVVPVGNTKEAEEADRTRAKSTDSWASWFMLCHYYRLTQKFKNLIGDDMFAAIATQDPT